VPIGNSDKRDKPRQTHGERERERKRELRRQEIGERSKRVERETHTHCRKTLTPAQAIEKVMNP